MMIVLFTVLSRNKLRSLNRFVNAEGFRTTGVPNEIPSDTVRNVNGLYDGCPKKTKR